MDVRVNQVTGPIKFCFLIIPNSSKSFSEALKMAWSMWGGGNSPILPFYEELPASFRNEYMVNIETIDYYKNSIENFDPDIIIYDDSLNKENISKVIGDRILITFKVFDTQISSNQIENGIGITQILRSTLKDEFKYERVDKTKLIFPKYDTSDLFLSTFLGSINSTIEKSIVSQLENEPFFQNPTITMDTIHTLPKNRIDIYELNFHEIKTIPKTFWLKGSAIYFINPKRITDLINFWNLRALGWDIVPISVTHLNNEYFSDLVHRFIKWQLGNSNNSFRMVNYLIGVTTTIEEKNNIDILLDATKKLIEIEFHYSFQNWYPRFWADKEILEADKSLCYEHYVDTSHEYVEVTDSFIKFPAKRLPFEINTPYTERLYKVNLTLSYRDEFIDNAGVIYGINTIDWVRLIGDISFEQWRLSRIGLCYYLNSIKDEIYLQIPNAFKFYVTFFSKYSFTLRENPNGKLALEVLKNIGGIHGIYFIAKPEYLKLFELFEEGKIISYKAFVGQIKRFLNYNNEKTKYLISRFIENKIIEIGVSLQCKVCNQRSFYLLERLRSEMVCNICRNSFGLPMHDPNLIEWGYSGIGPFSRNNKVGGIICVFMCLKLFKNEFAKHFGSLSAIMGFELVDKAGTVREIDLALLVKQDQYTGLPPDFFICECKTYKRFTDEDFERMKELGNIFSNAILTFATLNEQFEPDEIEGLKTIVNYFRKGKGHRPENPVLLLTASELIGDNPFRQFSDYDEKLTLYQKHNDRIGYLAQLTVQKHLNMETWGAIKEREWKENHAQNRN